MTQVIAAPAGADQPPPSAWTLAPVIVVGLLALGAVLLIVRRRWWSLAAAPLRPGVLAPEVGFAFVAAMFILGQVGIVAARKAWGVELPAAPDGATLDVDARTRLALGLYAGQAIVGAAWLLLAIRAPSPRPDWRRSRAGAIGAGLLALAFVWPIVSTAGVIASWITQLVTGATPDVLAHETLRALLDRGLDGWSLTLGALVVLVTPVLEELLYRGLLQESLRRLGLGPWVAITLTSVLFAVMHWTAAPPHAVFALFLLSLGFGWAYERTGRLAAPIVMHVGFNGGNLALAGIVAG